MLYARILPCNIVLNLHKENILLSFQPTKFSEKCTYFFFLFKLETENFLDHIALFISII